MRFLQCSVVSQFRASLAGRHHAFAGEQLERGQGWGGLIALVAGFGAAVPFMNTTLFVGAVPAHLLYGGDIA